MTAVRASVYAIVWLVGNELVMTGTHAQQKDCGVYLAPSTIPGAGLGMFAGNRPYNTGDIVAYSDLMVILNDMEWHNGDKEYSFLWDEYTWTLGTFDGMEDDMEHPSENGHVASFGFGAAINCMLPLINVADEDDYEKSAYEVTTSGVSSESPGAGAFTPYTGRRFAATTSIPPFAELYANYGEDYFENREAYETVPKRIHYREADAFARKYIRLIRMTEKRSLMRSNDDVKPVFERDVWNLVLETRKIWKSKMLHALPGENTMVSDLELLLEEGGTRWQHFNASIKSQEYMDEHGQCMDNIKNDISKIPHAGRGAFASRFIPKGGLVSPAPLIHVPDRSILTIYDSRISDEQILVRDDTKPVHQQLILNYCFGHRDSTLLLCPYGLLTGLINHDSKNPNTKLAWSDKRRLRHPEWFDQPINQWGGIMHSGISFDFIALRDIEEGEEITIDYGPEWELAWKEHVRQFQTHRPNYIPAFELNKILDLQIPTVDETDKHYDGVLVGCREHFMPSNHGVQDFRFGFKRPYDFDPFFLCRVLERRVDGDTYMYTAEVYERKQSIDGTYDVEETYYDTPKLILFDLPRDAFVFRDIPYERDHHQYWAFRHDMRIPDDLFPDVWRNDKKTPELAQTDQEL